MIEYYQQTSLPADYIVKKINEFLEEDIPSFDKTSSGIFSGKEIIKAYIQAEDNLIISGLNTLPYFFKSKVDLKVCFNDGDKINFGDVIAEITAPAVEILAKERVLLNLIQRMSGIATMTDNYVRIAEHHRVRILDTRKTTPGLRLFEKYAVKCGGGYNHRMDLSSGILIKDNHLRAAGNVKNAVESIKKMNYNLPVELEVDTIEQINEGLESGAEGFLLDNMDHDKTVECVKLIRSYPNGNDIFIESSGGINLSNLEDYVTTGINAISTGALTHSVKAANIHIEFE